MTQAVIRNTRKFNAVYVGRRIPSPRLAHSNLVNYSLTIKVIEHLRFYRNSIAIYRSDYRYTLRRCIYIIPELARRLLPSQLLPSPILLAARLVRLLLRGLPYRSILYTSQPRFIYQRLRLDRRVPVDLLAVVSIASIYSTSISSEVNQLQRRRRRLGVGDPNDLLARVRELVKGLASNISTLSLVAVSAYLYYSVRRSASSQVFIIARLRVITLSTDVLIAVPT